MSKSKYPNQIDTPSELPIVRDNIFEIGSDAINSIRSAIIQIEKTLGINPNGSVGLTVGERISQSLDSSGNIKREALDRAGLISGPIFDDQVSDSAAIRESKLKLNFPTQVLQSQISVTAGLIDEIQVQIEQISAKLSAHLSPDAANRHSAKSISTTAISSSRSTTAVRELAASNVQAALESVFSSHINYDGITTSSENNSHSASQIYFDNITTNVTSSNVQGALEEVADYLQTQVVGHQKLFHGAGSSKSSIISDRNNSYYGKIYIDSVTSSVTKNLGEKPYFELILDSPVPVLGINISTGDTIELTINSIKKEYQIYSLTFDSTKENITGALLFGTIESSESGVNTIVFSRRFRKKADFGIISSVRQNYGYSSSNIVQLINLDGPYIESDGINPNEISNLNKFFDLKINGTQYSFDIYDSAASAVQSIDSIVKKINETVDYLGLPILAFRVDKEGLRSEIVIAHNLSSSDFQDSSLEIIRNDGSIDSLGFTKYEGITVYGDVGSSYYIAGEKYTGLLKKLDYTGFSIEAGSRNINSGATAIDFVTYGIKKGDIVNIIDSSYMNSYEITDVTSSYLTVSSRQLPSGFSTDTVGTTRVIIYDAAVNVSNSEFLKIGVDGPDVAGSSLFEIFLDQNRKLNANLILEQEAEVYSGMSIYQILDFKNDNNVDSFIINFEAITSDNCVYVWLDDFNEKKKVVGNNNYISLKSNIKNIECLVFIPNITAAYNQAVALGGSFSKTVYLNTKINNENNLKISNVHYSNSFGKFDGGINGSLSLSKLNIGNLEEKDISTSLKRVLTETPISELRSSGFISGLEITSVSDPDGYTSGYYLVSISDGICYIEGKRFAISGVENYNSGIDAALYDKLYVGIDYNGNFVFSGPDPLCTYPWSEDKILLIGTIERPGSYYNIYDQRLFINNLDLKLLNSITVSPQPGMGHFTDIRDAIRYAKKFSEIYPKAGTPEIHLKSGRYEINLSGSTSLTLANWFLDLDVSGSTSRIDYFNNLIDNNILIDFPVTIRGEGPTSIIEIVYNLVAADQTIDISCGFFVAGTGFNTTSGMSATKVHSRVNYSVCFDNFYMNEGWIALLDINLSFGKFKINNITFGDLTSSTTTKALFKIGSNRYYSVVLSEMDNTSSWKGNVLIDGCIFQNGQIRLYPNTTPSRWSYISVTNCFAGIASISFPLLSDTTLFPASNKVFLSSNHGYISSAKDRVSEDLIVGSALSVGGNVTIGGSVSSGAITSTGNILTPLNISATSYTISGANKALRVIPMPDFYSILQFTAGGPYGYSGVSFVAGASTLLSAPAALYMNAAGSYVWVPIDTYLINNSSNLEIGIIAANSSATSSTIQVSLYAASSVGSSATPTLIDSDTDSISVISREELGFSLTATITRSNLYYLKIEVLSGVAASLIYRVSLLQNYNQNIETAINVF